MEMHAPASVAKNNAIKYIAALFKSRSQNAKEQNLSRHLGSAIFYELIERGLQRDDEVWVHEFEVVWNVEAVDWFSGDGFGEFRFKVA